MSPYILALNQMVKFPKQATVTALKVRLPLKVCEIVETMAL